MTGAACIAMTLSACAAMPASGPSSRIIKNEMSDKAKAAGSIIEVVDVTGQ
jgi:hypothetical protein